MAKCLSLSVGLVKENYSKDDILEYLKDEVLKVAFKKLIVFASEKTIQSGLNEFFDYLKRIKIEFTVFSGEDKENMAYLNKVVGTVLDFVDESDGILWGAGYVSGFFVVKHIIAPTKDEEEEFKKENRTADD
jgi:hypothetical protein